MNIPESVIQPFEPHGLPALTLIVWEPDGLQVVYDNLELTYNFITDLELDDGTAWARETLEGCAAEHGAFNVTVRDQPLKGSKSLGYMVYFQLGERNYVRLLCKK